GYRPILGLRHPVALGQRTRDCWPEAWAFNEPIYRRVMASGESVFLQDQEYAIEPSGVREVRYFTLSFAPARDESGSVCGVMVVVLETTRRVVAERENVALLAAARGDAGRLRLMFAQAPGFMALLKGPEHVFEVTNPAYMRLLPGREVIGKSVREAIPESTGQGFADLLDTVYSTGEPFVGTEMPFVLSGPADSPVAPRYLNFVYQPVKDAQGQVTGVFVEGSDITVQHDAQLELQRLNRDMSENIVRLEEADRRQSFQLRLAERLRPLDRPADVTAAACELLGQHLGLSRVLFCEVDDELGTFFIRHDWTRPGLASLARETRRLDEFGPLDIAALRAGEAMVRDDITKDSRSAGHAQAYARMGIRAMLAIPLVRSGRLTVIFNLQQVEPHHWSESEVQLAKDVAEWSWAAAESDRAQAELRAERDQSQLTFDNMTEGFGVIDRNWRVTQMNAVGLRFGHRTARQVIGKNHWEVWPETLGTEVEALYRGVMETGTAAALEQLVMLTDEHKAWFQISVQRMVDGGLAIFFRDITEEKSAADALRVSQTRSETALRVALLGTFIWDSITDAAECSDRTREIFGFTAAEGHVAADYFARILEEDVERVRADLAATLEDDGRIDTQYRIRRSDGTIRHVVCQGASQRDAAGAWQPHVGVFHDVTERENAGAVLRDIDRRKDDFLAMLAHELRNPLAPIMASAEILRRPGVDARSIERLSAIILRQTGHMTGLLADLLDVSRVSKGLVALDREVLDLKQIVIDAIEQTRPLMEQRRHHFSLHMSAQPIRVEGDPLRLVQVFANILTNAARYTPEAGEIVLSVAIEQGQAVVRVRDNGEGISPDLLSHIFDIFTQAKRSSDRNQGGLGLGLALVKHLVAMLGGKVAASSAGLGLGSEFTVHLPLLPEEPRDITQPAPLLPTPVRKSKRIMVVDDNVDAAATLAILLEMDGHAVSVEHTAQGALDAALRDRPEVILLDIGLPGMDGHSVARQLRADPATAGALLVALTGYSQPEDREESRAAGIDHHFDKPADLERLLEVIERGRPD
ncbi:MAG: PAS domain-containing protein, partial [Burkholderiaceae bacterium]